MSKLLEHAEYELRRAGLFDQDSDYDGDLGRHVLALVKQFTSQGHSGASACRTLELFNIVANYDNLMPLTSDPAEWNDVGDNTWQNKRNSKYFSNDGGKTWYNVMDKI